MFGYHYKQIVFFLLVPIAVFCQAEDGRALLTEALEVSKNTSYKTTIQVKGRDYRGLAPDQRVVNGVFFRLVSKDGFVSRRLELSANRVVYLQNRDGQYGIAPEYSAKIDDVQLLFHLEKIILPIDKKELDLATFTVSDARYNGIHCYDVVMQTPTDQASLQEISGLDQAAYQKVQTIMENRPVWRSFKIGKTDKIIYSRTHKNAQGKKTFALELNIPEFRNDFSLSLFETPEHIASEVQSPTDFYKNLQSQRQQQANVTSISQWFSRFYHKIIPAAADSISLFCFVLAGGIFGLLILWKRREKHKIQK